MKRMFMVLLAVLMVFALVSCEEPKAEPEPTVVEAQQWVVWGKSGSMFEDMKFNVTQYELGGAKVKSVKVGGVAMAKTWANEHTFDSIEALNETTGQSVEDNRTAWADYFQSPETIDYDVLYSVLFNTVTIVDGKITIMTSVKNIDDPLPADSVEIKFSEGSVVSGVVMLAD